MASEIDRKGFLKYAFATLAAGVGVMVAARPAFALNATCCRVTSGCPRCEGPTERYNCTGCPGGSFCTCAEQGQFGRCFTTGC